MPTEERERIRNPTPPLGSHYVRPGSHHEKVDGPYNSEDFENELTPTPKEGEPTALEAFEHASRVNQRIANRLNMIAHSAGVGLHMGDEVRAARETADRTAKFQKKIMALLIAAVTAAGSALVGVAKALYEKGGAEATMKARINYLEHQAERSRIEVDRLRDRLNETYWRTPTRNGADQ
jgi:hypothetical protein